jgi:hypothetical protein
VTAFLLPALLLALATPAALPDPLAESAAAPPVLPAWLQDAPGPYPAPGVDGAPERRFRVHLLTMDRGDEVYEMFGHNALLIEDALTGQALAWNWGLFNFEDVDFIPRFLRGTMRYSMGPADPEPFLRSYQAANRAVYANEIFLSEAQAAELDAFVRWNFEPENRPYIYDYYRDNCSTRLRDALDLVLGGVLQTRFADASTGRSFRWYSRQLVQVTGWVDQGLSYLLGMRGDRPISAWEAMFLPVELMAYLETVEIEREDGTLGPLLGPRTVVVEAARPPLPDGPPPPSFLLLGAGLLLGTLLALLAAQAAPARSSGGRILAEGPRGARAGLALAALAWGAFSGALGLLLVLAWFTDHHFIQANLNLAYTTPLALPLALGVAWILATPARGLGGLRPGARALALGVALPMVLVLLLQLVGVLRQGNADVAFVAFPANLALAWAAWRLTRGAPSAPRPR